MENCIASVSDVITPPAMLGDYGDGFRREILWVGPAPPARRPWFRKRRTSHMAATAGWLFFIAQLGRRLSLANLTAHLDAYQHEVYMCSWGEVSRKVLPPGNIAAPIKFYSKEAVLSVSRVPTRKVKSPVPLLIRAGSSCIWAILDTVYLKSFSRRVGCFGGRPR